jgi:hypothetical protein
VGLVEASAITRQEATSPQGRTTNATRFLFQAYDSPGLDVNGQSSGCNELTGSFEILDAEYGADGTVQKLEANVEQHCEGVEPALFAIFD